MTRQWLRVGLAVLLPAGFVGAQVGEEGQGFSQYDMYGDPVDVTVSDLAQTPDSYDERAVRTKGRFELALEYGRDRYMLQDTFGSRVLIMPVREFQVEFDDLARTLGGQEVQVVGLFRSGGGGSGMGTAPAGLITFWKFVGPPTKDPKALSKAPQLSLESLVATPGRHDGQTVRVVGIFRGRNLYGDLPVRSQRESADWVIKDDIYAVWVTGRKPKGSGFELDAGLKRDTGKWVEVIGRVESVKGVTYLRALDINLTTAPTATATAQPPPPPPERPKVPPVVVFALPLDGDREVPTNSQFRVQFSKDMEETSFSGHVVLRYAGARQPGDRDFVGAKISYDGGRKALTVDPGDVLRPGRRLELILLNGIVDVDGLALQAREASPAPEVADVFRYQVAPNAILGLNP
jgi:Bacterial Ig-like domain